MLIAISSFHNGTMRRCIPAILHYDQPDVTIASIRDHSGQWIDIHLPLGARLSISEPTMPSNENSSPAPVPLLVGRCSYDPKQLFGEPIGMFHCPECGEMVVAGMDHPDRPDLPNVKDKGAGK